MPLYRVDKIVHAKRAIHSQRTHAEFLSSEESYISFKTF